MIDTQKFDKYPVFGEAASKSAPDAVKYSAGFQEADVLPAEWMNWAWAKNSKCITDLNTGLTAVEEELNAVLDANGVVADGSKGQVVAAIKDIVTKNVNKIVDGEIEIKKLTVAGDIVQKGDNKKTEVENLYAKTARLGTRASSKPLAARNEDAQMKDGAIAVWDANNKHSRCLISKKAGPVLQMQTMHVMH